MVQGGPELVIVCRPASDAPSTSALFSCGNFEGVAHDAFAVKAYLLSQEQYQAVVEPFDPLIGGQWFAYGLGIVVFGFAVAYCTGMVVRMIR